MIEDGAVVAAGLVAERASNPTFADAGWADDEQILVPCDPLAGNEFLEQRPVEAARGFVVDVLDDSGLAQAGGLEAAFEALVLTLDRLAIDHHGETLLEGERGDIGLAALVFERLCHAGEPECDQAIMGGMGQHRFLLYLVVVATAADVAVPDRRAFRWLPLAVGPVEAMLEDRGDGAVAASADVVAAPAGGIEPLDAISLGEPQTG